MNRFFEISMKYLLYITCFSLLTFSCKKERLKNDAELLIGEWTGTHYYQQKTDGRVDIFIIKVLLATLILLFLVTTAIINLSILKKEGL